jgi:predicted nucleotidyltransferase
MSTRRTDDERPDQTGIVLFGKTRRRVLGWLYGHADQTFYLREIVRQAGSAQGAVQRELEALTRAGLLSRTVRGRQVYFQANVNSPIYAELQQILLKTAGLTDVLREALAPLVERIRVALVFGSAARGQLRSQSDIDLLVVGEVTFPDVARAVTGAQERLGRDVNPTVYPPAEFEAKIGSRHHFLTAVLSQPKLFVIGGPNELVRLGAKRVADDAHDESGGDKGSARRGRKRPAG